MTNSEDVGLHAPSLLELASKAIDPVTLIYDSASTVHLPLSVSQEMFKLQRTKWNTHGNQQKEDLTKEVLRAWCDAARLPLSNIDLTGAMIDDRILTDLLTAHQHEMTSLDLSNVTGITAEANSLLDQRKVHFPHMTRLKMTSMELLNKPNAKRKNGTTSVVELHQILMLNEADLEGAAGLDTMWDSRGGPSRESLPGVSSSAGFTDNDCDMTYTQEKEEERIQSFTSRCPNVRALHLPNYKKGIQDDENSTNTLLSRIFDPLKYLESLDLSMWHRLDDLRCLHPLSESLTTLVLFDVPDLYHAISTITQLTELRFLDISQAARETATYPRPVTTLHQIVTSLKKLTHLDISSTNLAAQPSADDFPKAIRKTYVQSDIAGLQALEKPLVFLGLFNCDQASHFREIPAHHVSGDANEDQLITALYMYKERSGLLQSVLNESYQLYRFGNSYPLTRHTEALHLVLDAMQRHLNDSTLQIAGSASLFYIIRKVDMNRETKRQVVSALLSGMEVHMEEQVMVRNCCLSLCQFEIPQDILFDYSRLAILLVTVLQHHNADNLSQRIVVFLLNSMACHVEGDQKVQVGSFGAIEMILDQIKRKLDSAVCDDVMEVGWSFLWNITDETPINCEKFLKADGLTLFQKCYAAFTQERELVRNMMGLIGNIAEVDSLRSQLMKDEYVTIFCSLLHHVEDSIEISYNSAGVLAHMASDGKEAWSSILTCRDKVMASIVKATANWELRTRRFINYRSFRPILRLLPLYDAYASQHWAVWALANLTTTDAVKYCAYVIDEGGVPLLEELSVSEQTTDEIRKHATTVLTNINNWKNGIVTEDSRSDSGDEMET